MQTHMKKVSFHYSIHKTLVQQDLIQKLPQQQLFATNYNNSYASISHSVVLDWRDGEAGRVWSVVQQHLCTLASQSAAAGCGPGPWSRRCCGPGMLWSRDAAVQEMLRTRDAAVPLAGTWHDASGLPGLLAEPQWASLLLKLLALSWSEKQL